MSAILTACQLGSAVVDALEILASQLLSIAAAALVIIGIGFVLRSAFTALRRPSAERIGDRLRARLRGLFWR